MGYLVALSVLGVALQLQAQVSNDRSAEFDRLVRSAVEAQRAGNANEAASALKQALEIRPEWADGTFYLATIYFQTQQFAEAVPVLLKLSKLKPNEGVVWALLGIAEFQVGDYDSALSHLKHGDKLGLRAAPEALGQAYLALGELLNRNGEFGYAQRVLEPVARKGTFMERARFALGINLLQIRALSAEISDAESPLIRAAGEVAVALDSSRYNDAFQQLDRLIAQYPNDPRLRGVYGWSLATFSRFDEAEGQFREQIRIAPDSPSPWVGLGELFLKRQRWKDARDAATRVLTIAPDSADGHEQLGRALLELGDIPESITHLEIAVKLAGKNPETHFSLARAYTKANRLDDAKREREIFTQLKANPKQ
jgi:tetratricopeptide (TPR) repeat protein